VLAGRPPAQPRLALDFMRGILGWSARAHQRKLAIGVLWPEGHFSVQTSCCSAMTGYGPRSNLPAQVGVRRLFDSPVDSFHSVVDSNVNDRMTLPDRPAGYFGRFEGRV
jgi:hypothetical protein